MKKLKISIVAVLAIVLSIGASSFTHRSSKVLADEWFSYNGGTMTVPGNYTYEGTEPPCSGTATLCAIKVTNDGSNQPLQSALTLLYDNNNRFAAPVTNLIDFKP